MKPIVANKKMDSQEQTEAQFPRWKTTQASGRVGIAHPTCRFRIRFVR
jgi:hypothetical protein